MTASDKDPLDALLSAAADAIILADEKGTILRSNPAAERLFRYAPGELEGCPITILMPEREATRHDAFMHHHLTTGETRIIGTGRELEGRRKSGETFPLHLSVGRSDGPEGPQFVAILHDLTRRRSAEHAAERAQRLEALAQMTGGIAHDFNNLLTLIIGNLEIAAHRDVTPDVRGILNDALDAASMGSELTEQLLAFARQSRLAPEKLDLNSTVERAAAMFRHQMGRGHRIDLSADPNLWPIELDPAQLQSAIVNLLRNAVDAMDAEGVILIETANMPIDDAYTAQELDVAPGRFVRLSISDTGCGMAPEVRLKAFEPFFTTKPPGEATGLGLATVYGFMRQSGGQVTLHSEPGEGTTVRLFLPAAAVPDAPAPELTTGALHPLPGRGEVVLLVEDNDQLRALAAIRLDALGYRVLEAHTADEARDMLEAGTSAELVFADIMLPGEMSGLDLARYVRETRPDLPVLLTTGYAGELTHADAIEDFPMLRKPYRQEDLLDAVKQALWLRTNDA